MKRGSDDAVGGEDGGGGKSWLKLALPWAVVAVTVAAYIGVVAVGGRVAKLWGAGKSAGPMAWKVEPLNAVGAERRGMIELGRKVFTETPVYAAGYVRGRVSCSNCHLEGGIAPFAVPLVGSAQSYPKWSPRAGREVTLEDRVQECMTRSENGLPLPGVGREMKAVVAYVEWLSEPHAGERAFVGRGLNKLPKRVPDARHGEQVYAAQCAGCHGARGEGVGRQFPPLWGADASNDGAGMLEVEKMAAFVQYNMPHNRKGILSAQDAYDVAAFVHAQPRPAFNHDFDRY